MTKKKTIPVEPTLDMCEAYMKATGWPPKERANWRAYLAEFLGTPHECRFVNGLRAALRVGAGIDTIETTKKGNPLVNSKGMKP